jgi:hypothetical protein
MSDRWSENNLPSAQDVAAAKATLSELTRGGQLANTDLIDWVNARITVDWAAAAASSDTDGLAR